MGVCGQAAPPFGAEKGETAGRWHRRRADARRHQTTRMVRRKTSGPRLNRHRPEVHFWTILRRIFCAGSSLPDRHWRRCGKSFAQERWRMNVPLRHCGRASAQSGALLFAPGWLHQQNPLTNVPVSAPVGIEIAQRDFAFIRNARMEGLVVFTSMKGQPHEAHDNRFILSPDARFHPRACTSW